MDDAGLHRRRRENRLDRLREALQPVDAADQDVGDAALLELGEDLHPELRALGLLEPHPEHVPLTVDGDAEGEVAGPALHRPALPDLQDERVEEEHRLDVVQGPLLPLAHVVHHRAGDAADQVAADPNAVDLGQVRLDLTGREAARVERENLVVEALEAPLPLRTICGSNVPFRSRGVRTSTGPCSVASVFAVEPLRVLPLPPGGSW
jgi:hypothetical protein